MPTLQIQIGTGVFQPTIIDREKMKTIGQLILFLFTVTAANAQGNQLEVIASFGSSDGSSPRCTLVQAPNGSFYGTTYSGGNVGIGTTFKVTSTGILTTLTHFNGANGAYPNSLALGNDGNFYGTCAGGVAGNVFRVTTDGALTNWFPFSISSGFQPLGSLVIGTDGNFYGVTSEGRCLQRRCWNCIQGYY